MHSNKTFVILTPGFAANEADTTCLPGQQQFVQCLQEMHPHWNVLVLAFQYPFVRSTYNWKNVQVISFGGRNRGKLARLVTWYRVWRKLTQSRRENEVAGLLSFWCTECALVGQYFSRRHKLPHFTWLLGQDAKKDNRFIRLVAPRAAQLVALSDFLALEFERNHGVRPAHIIPLGLDTNLFTRLRQERNIDVLGAGSLIPLKQYDVFIRIIGRLSKKYPAITAVICGKGPELVALQELVKHLGLENNVRLAGEISNPGVLRLMQQCRVFLHTSCYEGFGMVCLEALYAGAHVVSFVKPMHTGIGHWHIVNNEAEMENKMLELLSGHLTHTPVLAFSMKDTVHQIAALYPQSAHPPL